MKVLVLLVLVAFIGAISSHRFHNATQLNGSFNQSAFGKYNRTIRGPLKQRELAPKWIGPIGNSTWNQTTNNGDLFIGQIGYLDRLLFNQTYKKPGRWWGSRDKVLEYPHALPGNQGYNRKETITAIRIFNKFFDGLTSNARILAGGVGYRYVKIKLSSPWNKGFEYLVQIYGR